MEHRSKFILGAPNVRYWLEKNTERDKHPSLFMIIVSTPEACTVKHLYKFCSKLVRLLKKVEVTENNKKALAY